jgi:hypothetical protein
VIWSSAETFTLIHGFSLGWNTPGRERTQTPLWMHLLGSQPMAMLPLMYSFFPPISAPLYATDFR